MNRYLSVLILVLVAGLGAGATLLVQRALTPHISSQQRLIENQRLLDMLPTSSYDNQPLDHPLALKDVALANSTLLGGYLATLEGQTSAILLLSRSMGHEAAIDLLIAIDPRGKLLGVKALKQAETPGLGGTIATQPNPWLRGFIGKSRQDPTDSGWALKKDQGRFDQLAGATITSRAVIGAVHDALRYFDEHQPQLVGSGQ
ncbi:electron transporter RnfG [Pseudomonas sp. FW300-N1A1]|uniref:RnfABCDGE type electron transport complex subunit G n=1 Tax=Pseudomonas sp. FW300-N1A1 TaxID=2075555 RepID=UPI000CD20838|nr:RnfABCDGE type electron transport complex subunit G [Pseudomonas sp. FW300-N1A1]POA18785.1 electron transporter RnfG [Pseudomonas sp. FW300-N1A1]